MRNWAAKCLLFCVTVGLSGAANALPLPTNYFGQACAGNDCIDGAIPNAELDRTIQTSGSSGGISGSLNIHSIASPYGPHASVQLLEQQTIPDNLACFDCAGRPTGGSAMVTYDVTISPRPGLVFNPGVIPIFVDLVVHAQLSTTAAAYAVAGAHVETNIPTDPSGIPNSSLPFDERFVVGDARQCVGNTGACSSPSYRGSGQFAGYVREGTYQIRLTASVGGALRQTSAFQSSFAGADPVISIGPGFIPGTNEQYSDWFDVLVPAGVTQAVVPEPGTSLLAVGALLAIAGVRRSG